MELFFKEDNTPVLLSKWYSSFMPILMKVMSLTTGDVLELGTGIYSTPYLHWNCYLTKRLLVSYENSEIFTRLASEYEDDFHIVYKVESFTEVDIEKPWSVVLLDEFPIEDRVEQLRRLANHAQYIVVHDTSNEELTGICKYRFDDGGTTVFSNFIDVTNLWQ